MKSVCRLYLQLKHDGAHRVAYILQEEPENSSTRGMRTLVRIWGAPLEATSGQIIECLKRSGHRPAVLQGKESEPLPLDEPAGVRLALVFLAVKPLRKLRRVEVITKAIQEMEPEETYYWLAKCSRQRIGRRACHALRVLLSKE